MASEILERLLADPGDGREAARAHARLAGVCSSIVDRGVELPSFYKRRRQREQRRTALARAAEEWLRLARQREDETRREEDIHESDSKVTVIQKIVANRYGVSLADILSHRRTKITVRPRTVAVWLTKELTILSLPAIGRAFGGRHHTTILYSVRKIEGMRQTVDGFDAEVGEIKDAVVRATEKRGHIL